MPNYVVPKPHSDDWCLVNDLSAGPFSLNSMVDCQLITGFLLDNLSQLGELTAGTGWCFPQKNPFLDMFCDF